MKTTWSSDTWLVAQPSSVPSARHFVRFQLCEHLLSHLTDDVELVASELATNAVLHARTAFRVTLKRSGQTLRLEVEDGSRAEPVRVVAQVFDETGGRGMAIVRLLTRDWGVDRHAGGGKSVWAEFDPEPADGDEGPVAQQGRPRALTEPWIGTRGPIDSIRPEGLLSNLLGDVKEARVYLHRVRARGSREAVCSAHTRLAASLTIYVEALDWRHLPVPDLLRDEFRLYARTSAART